MWGMLRERPCLVKQYCQYNNRDAIPPKIKSLVACPPALESTRFVIELENISNRISNALGEALGFSLSTG